MKKLFLYYRIIFILLIIINIIILDRISKNWIINNLLLFELKPITTTINFFYIRNYGAAFSIFSDNTGKINYFLCLISSISILIICKIMYDLLKKKIFYNIPYALIISGAIGNLIDRYYFGYVVDFIDFHIQNWHFATFNISDISIFIGSILFLFKKK